MSKPIKELVIDEYRQRFADVENALVVDIRGIAANDNNEMRLELLKQDIRVTVVKNTLAQKAIAGTSLEALSPALDGPAALAYGAESVIDVARALVDWARKLKQLDLKAAVLDGEFFDGEDAVKKLSTFPTREEAHAKVVQVFLSPARNVVGAATSPGAALAGILKTIEEKLEKGETITK
jgi:large subunit ribosomal protein L10